MPCKNTEIVEKNAAKLQIFRGPNTSKEKKNVYALSLI